MKQKNKNYYQIETSDEKFERKKPRKNKRLKDKNKMEEQ